LGDAELAPTPMTFRRRLYPMEPSWHTWDGKRLVHLAPRDVRVTERGVVLLTGDGAQTRAVEMVEEAGQWKIDWVHAPLGGPPTSATTATIAPATRPSK
jgi:hypothetical protein